MKEEMSKPVSSELVSLEQYVCHVMTDILIKFFEKPFNDQPKIDVQVRPSGSTINPSRYCMFSLVKEMS